jgi:hypothetical protein
VDENAPGFAGCVFDLGFVADLRLGLAWVDRGAAVRGPSGSLPGVELLRVDAGHLI